MSERDGAWWIRAGGRAWGPYPLPRLRRFHAEGRFGPASLVGREEDGPYVPAAEAPDLVELFTDGSRSPAAPAFRPMLVILDAPAPAAAFAAALASCGEVVGIRPGLWLLRAREGAAAVRNVLSRTLAPADRLLVAEAPIAGAAWFNLDGGTDRALRRLWAIPPTE